MAEQARKEAKRSPVSYRYDALNWEFIKLLAEIANYAGEKYGAPEQYTESRLTGDKSPVNHITEHLRAYLNGEEHDHFGTVKHQLAAVAYNAMMEFYYLSEEGPTARNLFQPSLEAQLKRNPLYMRTPDGVITQVTEPAPAQKPLTDAVQLAFDFAPEPEPTPTIETVQDEPDSPRSKLLQFFANLK